jgi:cytochrome c oxidase cbb3-type subunit 1
MEGLMWREVDANGFLVNAFADTVAAKFPMYVVRALGGLLYVTGAVLMAYNLYMTATRGEEKKSAPATAVAAE